MDDELLLCNDSEGVENPRQFSRHTVKVSRLAEALRALQASLFQESEQEIPPRSAREDRIPCAHRTAAEKSLAGKDRHGARALARRELRPRRPPPTGSQPLGGEVICVFLFCVQKYDEKGEDWSTSHSSV